MREQKHHLSTQSFDSKMHLLSYALSDGKYIGMEGICLLPLDNGSFEILSEILQTVYIDSDSHSRALLMPGFTGRFLNQGVPKNILHHFQTAIYNSGKSKIIFNK